MIGITHHLLICWVVTFCQLLFSNISIAQDRAFETLSPTVYYQKYFKADNTFDRIWKPDNNVGISASTPFYLGKLMVGVDFTSYEVMMDANSDFRLYHFYGGWGEEFRITPDVHLAVYGCIADNFMTFKIGGDKERELSYGLITGISWNVRGNWFIESHLRYRKILTFHPIRLLSASLGVRYRIELGSGLIKILQ